MKEFRKYTLEELIDSGDAKLQTGPFGTMLKAREYVDAGVPVIAVQDIGNNRLFEDNIVYVHKDTAERLSRYKVQSGDIVFGRKGAVDRRALIREKESGWIQGSDCIRLRLSDNIDSRFLSYQLGSPILKSWILGNAHGTTMPSLNQDILKRMPLVLPPLAIQKKIAAILSSLDDKIELNTRMNNVLEEIARALFHRWFVEFEFPDAEGEPYKSAGGKMVESEMGMVPEGWEVGKLGDIIELSYGKPLKEENRSGNGFPVFGSNGVVGWHNEWMVAGPGIIVGRKGTAGTVTWSHENFFPIDTTFFVCPFMSIYGRYGLHFLYLLLKTLNLPHLTSDSAVPGLNRNTVLIQKILIPNIYIVNKFELVVSSIFSQIYALELENKALISLKDILLPKLMCGELELSETHSSGNKLLKSELK